MGATRISDQLGTVLVKLCEYVKTGVRTPRIPNERILQHTLLHERTKKVGAHMVRY